MEGVAQTLLVWKIWIVGGWFGAILICEHTLPIRRERHKRLLKRYARNLTLFGLNGIASPLFVLYTAYVSEKFALNWRPDTLHPALGLCLDILLIDAFIYWWHRANHEIPFLWRFHEVHHLDEELDSTTGVRFHIGEVTLSTLLRSLIVVVFDVPLTSVLIAEVLLQLVTLLQHSNLNIPPRLEHALGWVFITPDWHQFHHRARRCDTDSNYGNIFSWWDRLFATANPQRTPPSVRIGVEHRRDMSIVALLWAPFRRRPDSSQEGEGGIEQSDSGQVQSRANRQKVRRGR